MTTLPQSTAYVVMLKVFLSTDHVTAATGKTVAIVISKAGAAFGNLNAGATNATEVSNGWYKVSLDATDTNTLGDLVVRGTSAGCDDSERILVVENPAATFLKYDMSTITGEAAKSPINCFRKLRNWSISAGVLTVYKEDGTTAAYTQTLAATPGANPITSISG